MRYVASALISSVLCAFVIGAGACSGSDGGEHGAIASGDGGSGESSSGDAGNSSAEGATPVVDAAPNLACERAAQSKAAPTSLYDALTNDLSALSGADRQTRADKFVADVTAAGGTPLQDPGSTRVVFIAQGAPPDGTWNIGGSFRNADWTQNTLPMTQISGTDLWVVDTTAPRGTEYAYKLLSGSDPSGFTEDPLSKNIIWDGINHNDVGFFNSLFFVEDGDQTKGRLVRYGNVHATELNEDHPVYVYLPAKYDDGSCAALPHLLVHDGNESLTRGDFQSVTDTEFAAHPDESAVLVFVALPNQDVRTPEYTFGSDADGGTEGDAYGDFLRNDLEPKIAVDYRVCAKPDDMGLSGASLGGLISTYLTFEHSELWGYDGAQSASLFWDDNAMISRASALPKVPVRFYFDNGIPSGTCGSDDNCQPTRDMVAALQAASYQVTHVEVNDAEHDWPYWQSRFPQMLAAFRAGKSACSK
jgi:enterochelin esterase family protein